MDYNIINRKKSVHVRIFSKIRSKTTLELEAKVPVAGGAVTVSDDGGRVGGAGDDGCYVVERVSDGEERERDERIQSGV
jgi:hypothetical protein